MQGFQFGELIGENLPGRTEEIAAWGYRDIYPRPGSTAGPNIHGQEPQVRAESRGRWSMALQYSPSDNDRSLGVVETWHLVRRLA